MASGISPLEIEDRKDKKDKKDKKNRKEPTEERRPAEDPLQPKIKLPENVHHFLHQRNVQLWDNAVNADPSIADKLCDDNRIREAAVAAGDEKQGREWCNKLASKVEAKESVVGDFMRCASVLSKQDAVKLDCRLTPYSHSSFFFYWSALREKGAILVFGQGPNADQSRSRLQLKRAHMAAGLHANTGYPVIATGGDDGYVGTNEAWDMVDDLIAHGVPPELIGYDPQAFSTAESAFFSLRLIRRFLPEIETIVLVTSDFHMPRAAFIFQLILHHMQRDDLTNLPKYFKDKTIKLDLEPVKSDCTPGTNKDLYDGAAGNSLKARVWFEHKVLHSPGWDTDGQSVLAADAPYAHVWGQNIQVLPEYLKTAREKIDKLKSEVGQCTGGPA